MKRKILSIMAMLVCLMTAMAQQTITGSVTDEGGQPIPGASVVVQGTTNGVATDFDGNYSITVNGGDVLVFSFVGFVSQNITVGIGAVINVILREDTQLLDEVIVVGYGVQKKETLSGAVSNVKGEELVSVPVTNVSQGIAGRLPGVVAISGSGEPGADNATIRIRGVGTFGKADPLVVVDGVPGRSLNRIDPTTIESMSVLKDASAAIYGAQAANGVILITTKRGKIGKPSVSLSFNQGYSRPTVVPEMANAAEYTTLLNEIDRYAGNPERYTQEDIQNYRNASDPWFYPNTDWFAETLKDWSSQTNTNLSISGGTENMKYFVSLSHRFQDGMYKNSANDYNQYDLRTNLDIKVNDYLDLYLNTSGRMEDRDYPVRSAGDIFRMVMRGKPHLPAYWPNGLPGPDIEFGNNPVVVSTDATGYDRDNRYIANIDMGMNLKVPGIDGLTFRGNVSIDKRFRFRKIWQKPWDLYTWDYQTYDENGEPNLIKGQRGFSDARLREQMWDDQNLLFSGIFNYDVTLNEAHNLNLLAGVERIEKNGDDFFAFRRFFLSTAIDELFAGGQEEMNTGGKGYEEARLNYFGRVNYNYNSKYLAEFVWRYQGSYIFEQAERFGFFPGISLGYVISEESFFEEALPFVSFAKLRASYGKTGNDLIDPYQYFTAYQLNDLFYISNNGGSQTQGLREGVIPNAGVTWEEAIQQNFGVDLRFLNGDLRVTADYFKNKREKILWNRNAAVPKTLGASLPRENLGEVENKGFDFNIDYRNTIGDFSYGVGLNGVFSKNKILFWDEAAGAPDYQLSEGSPIDAQLYYQAIGVFEDQAAVDAYPHWDGARPGDVIFKDVNEDGVIDADDRVRNDKTRVPTFTGGLNIDLGYKGFDLAILLQGATGGVFYENTESGEIGNFTKEFYDNRWTEDNPSSEHPRTFNRVNEYWRSQRNTYWLRNTDYVRLKNIELGYTLPKELIQKFQISSLRLYMSGFNLLTYSPDIKNFDPEVQSESGQSYPLNKVVNFGVNVTF